MVVDRRGVTLPHQLLLQPPQRSGEAAPCISEDLDDSGVFFQSFLLGSKWTINYIS